MLLPLSYKYEYVPETPEVFKQISSAFYRKDISLVGKAKFLCLLFDLSPPSYLCEEVPDVRALVGGGQAQVGGPPLLLCRRGLLLGRHLQELKNVWRKPSDKTKKQLA